jgi:hypothetical protein
VDLLGEGLLVSFGALLGALLLIDFVDFLLMFCRGDLSLMLAPSSGA